MRKFKGAAFLLIGLLVGGLLGLLFLWVRPRINTTSDTPRLPPVVGSPAQDFNLMGLNGVTQSLSELKGKPVLINFWATWCPPCKEEMPLLERYAKRYQGKMVVLGVDYEEDNRLVQPYVKELGITFPILLDRSGKVSELYYARNFPTSFFVDANGILRAQHVGALSEDMLVQYLKTIGIEP